MPIANCSEGRSNSSLCCTSERERAPCHNRSMIEQRILETARLRLRPFEPGDAEQLQELAGARSVAEGTLLIPHPYPLTEAVEWIASRPQALENGNLVYAVTLRASGALIGAMGLVLRPQHDKGELGYWIGEPYWGQGFATEAARAVVDYGFDTFALNRVFAIHFTRNPASGRVLEKSGMRHEGSLRQDVKKWDEYVDVEVYGILRSDRTP
jgi:ribosomal-protein-alanine N-acetyltransferase